MSERYGRMREMYVEEMIEHGVQEKVAARLLIRLVQAEKKAEACRDDLRNFKAGDYDLIEPLVLVPLMRTAVEAAEKESLDTGEPS